jgi:predicted aspartyl protease
VPTKVRNKNNEYETDSSSITINITPANPASSSTEKNSTAPSKKTNSISIPYTAREGYANRVIIDVTFNGQVTVPMMVDTGSPGLVISDNLAARLNLRNEEGGRLMVIISGIGGRKVATKAIIEN